MIVSGRLNVLFFKRFTGGEPSHCTSTLLRVEVYAQLQMHIQNICERHMGSADVATLQL